MTAYYALQILRSYRYTAVSGKCNAFRLLQLVVQLYTCSRGLSPSPSLLHVPRFP